MNFEFYIWRPGLMSEDEWMQLADDGCPNCWEDPVAVIPPPEPEWIEPNSLGERAMKLRERMWEQLCKGEW